VRELCAEAVAAGDFAGCERVMDWEMYEGEMEQVRARNV